jgi:hypothetical protein
MTQNITIRKKEGDEISFKLRKVESFTRFILDDWNKSGFVEYLTTESNKEFDTNDDHKSEKVQNRMINSISEIIDTVLSNVDLSEFPILWYSYEGFKGQLNGKNQVHFDKLSENSQDFVYNVFKSQLQNKSVFPKGVLEGNKYLNDGVESVVTVVQETYDELVRECKEKGYSSLVDKYGKENRVELYSDGTLFEPDSVRPIYTMSMVYEKNPEFLDQMENSFNNKIQKGVWEFYKDNGRSMIEFMEKCWTTKMESFHMLFEKGYGEEDKSGEREYQNLEGIRTLCEYLGFEILDDDIPFLPIGIPSENYKCKCGSRISFKDCHKDKLFKHFPYFERMYNEVEGKGIMFNVIPSRLFNEMVDSLERTSEKEKELVG